MSAPAPKDAEFITSRLARQAPSYAERRAEQQSESRLAAYIAQQPHTRYRVINRLSGLSHVAVVTPAQLMAIWDSHVITAIEFQRRWCERELHRLLGVWNRQKSTWMYVPVND